MPNCIATLIQLTLLVTSIIVTTTSASGFTTNQSPSIIIAQSNSVGPTRNGIVGPEGQPASDRAGNLWVADTGNNRVLAFTPLFTANMSASLVIGQRDFSSKTSRTSTSSLHAPYGVAFDAGGDLWVADEGNNRVLAFDPPFHSGMDASVVIGQQDFNRNSSNTTRTGLSYPEGLVFDASGDLWVVDSGNSRVLEFKAPFTSGMNASLVVGEPDFNHRYCNPSDLGYNKFCSNHSIMADPTQAGFDSDGNLWVAQFSSRLLEFTPPFSSGMGVSHVISEAFWVSALAFDSAGNLWLGCMVCGPDGAGHALEFRPPFSEGKNASVTLGQSFGVAGNVFAPTVMVPVGLTFDSSGNLWVVDFQAYWLMGAYGRVLGFDAHDHSVMTGAGQVHLKNSRGLLTPLTWIPPGNAPIAAPGWLTFLDGLFNFTIQGLNSTTLVTLILTFPQSLPKGTEWWSIRNGKWSPLPSNQILVNGTNLILTLNGVTPTGVISILGGPTLASNATSSTSTSTNATPPPSSLLGIPDESVAVGIVTGLVALVILRYRKHMRR